MLIAITVLFIIGYLAIALEHPLRIDKTATALLLGMTLWVLYAFGAETIVPAVSGEELKRVHRRLLGFPATRVAGPAVPRVYSQCEDYRTYGRYIFHPVLSS